MLNEKILKLMQKEKSTIDNTITHNKEIFIPNISVDCIILAFHGGSLKTLLCKFKVSDRWMLPGGFVTENEDPDEAVLRVLKEKTELDNVYYKQFYFFGKKGRIKPDENEEMLKRFYVAPDNGRQSPNRFISLGYYSLIKYDDAHVVAHEYEDVEWFDINEIPALYADHSEILNTAILTIRKQIGFVPVGYELLPEKFTMPELRTIYEAILGRELDRRNFQRKMLSIGYIQPLNETRKAGAHKSPNLYSFIKDKYEDAEKNGIQIMSNNF
jgi:hypothetical protein